jgi:hypothetical protein
MMKSNGNRVIAPTENTPCASTATNTAWMCKWSLLRVLSYYYYAHVFDKQSYIAIRTSIFDTTSLNLIVHTSCQKATTLVVLFLNSRVTSMVRRVLRGSASMRLLSFCLILIIGTTLMMRSIAAAEEEQSCRAVYDNGPPVCVSVKQPECGLYMAPSTLGEGANLGMYTSQDIPKNKIIQREIAIPFLFRTWNGPDYFHHWPELDKSGTQDDGALWYRYFWSGYVADLESFDETNIQGSKVVFVPGIGCTINSILEMRNVKSTYSSIYDTAGLSRGDPSAGAFCPYHSSLTKSLVDIPAGSEIFADYVSWRRETLFWFSSSHSPPSALTL